jgi:hypothetical protein
MILAKCGGMGIALCFTLASFSGKYQLFWALSGGRHPYP